MADSPDGKSETLPRPFGKYVLQREAGRGGKGVIYEATDSVLQRRVALKVLLQGAKADPEELKGEEEKFLLEARLGAHLPKHPNIVSVYEGGVIDDLRYLAAEFIDGEPMTLWRKNPAVTFIHQVRLLRDVALALDHVHRHNIVHRDIKPSNILVDKEGRPHITDFGLAKMLGQEADIAKTSTGKVWGTPAYVSPEHARGLDVDARSDLYPLGVMLYEALAGRTPFQGGSRSDVLGRVVREPVVAPSKVVALTTRQLELEPACLKALSKDPAGRHAGAKAFADELTRWLDVGKSVRRVTKKSQAPLYAGISAAALLVAGLALFLATMKKGPSPEEIRAQQAEKAKQKELTENEKQRAAAEAKKEAEEKAREEKERALKDAEAKRLAGEESAMQEQAKLEAQRREMEERLRKAEEKLKQAPTAVPVPPPTAPVVAVVPKPEPAPPTPPTPDPPKEAKPAPPPIRRLAAPSGPAVAEAEKEIKNLFKDEYQKKAAGEKAALAQKLLKAGKEANDDAVMQFVALREARELAASAGDVNSALQAIDAMDKHFVVNAATLKAAAYQTAVRVLEPDKQERAFATGLDLMDQLARDSWFDEALKVASSMEELAKKLRNVEYVKSAQSRAKELRTQKSEWMRVRAFADKLKQSPDDAEACLAMAKFHALAGNWETALPLLVKGGNPELKDAAEKDLARPKEPSARADVGDVWWTLSEKEKAVSFRSALQERAMNLYMNSLEGLPELRKAQIEKRLQAAVASAGTPLDKLKLMGLVFWMTPSGDLSGRNRDLVSGTVPWYSGAVPSVMESGLKVLKFDGSFAAYPASNAAAAFRDAGSCLAWFRPDKVQTPHCGLVFRGTPGNEENSGYADFSMCLHQGKAFLGFNWPDNNFSGEDGKATFWTKRPYPGGRWGMCGVTWGGGTVSVYFNGEKDNVYKAAPECLKRGEPGIVALGCDPAGGYEHYTGLMATAMLFNRSLTDAEIRQVCQIVGIQVK